MPFDPNQPQNGELIDAVQLRDQFNGLKALIDAQPATSYGRVAASCSAPFDVVNRGCGEAGKGPVI